MGDHEAHKFSATNPKGALFRVEPHVVLVDLSENFL